MIRKGFSFLVFSALLLTLLPTANADVRRRGLAKRYSIPPMSESYIRFGQAESAALNPNSINVMVWNILKGDRKKFERDFLKHGKDIDLFVLQEGFHNDKNERIMTSLPGVQWDFAVSFLWKKEGDTPGGTLLGSKAAPSNFVNERTHDLEPFIKTPKTLSIGTYPLEGRDDELLVISIHGINFTTTQTLQTQMFTAARYIKAHNGPVIFAGDFNTRNWDRYNAMVDVMNDLGMMAVSFKDDKRLKPFGVYLDHAFVRGLNVKNSVCLRKLKSSDHKAMVFEASVK